MEFQNLLPDGNHYGNLDGVNYVTCVPAPGDGKARLVFTLGITNAIGGAAIQVFVFFNSGAGLRYLIDAAAMAANTTFSLSDKYPNGMFLRDGQYLEVAAGAATTQEWYTAWADLPRLSGRRV